MPSGSCSRRPLSRALQTHRPERRHDARTDVFSRPGLDRIVRSRSTLELAAQLPRRRRTALLPRRGGLGGHAEPGVRHPRRRARPIRWPFLACWLQRPPDGFVSAGSAGDHRARLDRSTSPHRREPGADLGSAPEHILETSGYAETVDSASASCSTASLVSASWRSISISIVSLTSTPPVSSATFQLSPQSRRLIVPVRVPPTLRLP